MGLLPTFNFEKNSTFFSVNPSTKEIQLYISSRDKKVDTLAEEYTNLYVLSPNKINGEAKQESFWAVLRLQQDMLSTYGKYL